MRWHAIFFCVFIKAEDGIRDGRVTGVQTCALPIVHSFSHDTTAARGGFDRNGNPWFGGRNGALLQLDAKAAKIREFWPPTPYVIFYEAMPDKRGEVWAGELHGGKMLRFNPQADHWDEYVPPQPSPPD